MIQASKCPSSGENYCIYATLVFVTLKGGSHKLQDCCYTNYGV